jgi:hypothetical protein
VERSFPASKKLPIDALKPCGDDAQRRMAVLGRAGRLTQLGSTLLLCFALLVGCGSDPSPATTAGCSESAQCGAGLVCDMASGACVSGSGGSGSGGSSAGSSTASDSVAADTACTVNPQAGCPAGRVCMVANSSGTTSCYSTGTGKYGEACNSINDCEADLLCVYGQCHTRCDSVSDCGSAPYATCSPYPATSDNAAIPQLSFCSLQCNPADSSNAAGSASFVGCPAGAGCDPSNAGPAGTTDCYAAGTVPVRGACDDVTLICGPNLVCLTSSGGSGTCTPFCLMNEATCPTGTCTSFATEQQVSVKGSLVELGYCG